MIKYERPELCSFNEDFNNISNQQATHIINKKILSENIEPTTSIKFKNIITILHDPTTQTYVLNIEPYTAGYQDITWHEPYNTYKSFVSTWYEFWYQLDME